jgi:hypothetical protein
MEVDEADRSDTERVGLFAFRTQGSSMASQKQIDANRRNAQKSTGPITEAGKAVARFNALRHGMTAESAVLPYEDHLAYAMLREGLLSHYAPANIAEELLVDVVANSYWRLLRARRVETSTMKLGIQALKQRNGLNPAPSTKDDDALAVFFTDDNDNMRNQERYHSTIERSYFRAVQTLRKVQNDRLREERRTTAVTSRNNPDGSVSQPVAREQAKTIVSPKVDPTYAPLVRVWLQPEDEHLNEQQQPPLLDPQSPESENPNL